MDLLSLSIDSSDVTIFLAIVDFLERIRQFCISSFPAISFWWEWMMYHNSPYAGAELSFRDQTVCPVCLQKERPLTRKADKTGKPQPRTHPSGPNEKEPLEVDFHDDFECKECGRHWLSETLSEILIEQSVSKKQRKYVRETRYDHFGDRPLTTYDLPK